MPPKLQKRKRAKPYRGGLPWSDESVIERKNASTVRQSPASMGHLYAIDDAIVLIQKIIARRVESEASFDQLEYALLKLSIRIVNSTAAGLRLVHGGFYQGAGTMARDVMEVTFLLELFRKDGSELEKWISMPDPERRKEFSPISVRIKLEALEGRPNTKRAQLYNDLSKHAAHANPAGFDLITVGNDIIVGPFSSQDAVHAIITEFLRVTSVAALCISDLIRLPVDLNVEAAAFEARTSAYIELLMNKR